MKPLRKRIVFLNRSYWPDVEATGQLLGDLCAGLSQRYDVHVICGRPNSPEPGSRYSVGGSEKRDGVTIHRLAHRRFDKKRSAARILNLLSFYRAADRYLSQCGMMTDVVVSETDPFLLPIAGGRYARRVGAKHVVYLQDIYPDVADSLGKNRSRVLSRLIRSRLAMSYRDATRVLVLGRCMEQRLIADPWNVPRELIRTIPNWADCDQIRPVEHADNSLRRRLELGNAFVVMHSGNMGLTQRLDVLLGAAAEPDWPNHAKLLFVGDGASRDRLKRQAKQLALPDGRVRFLHYQPRHELATSLSAADLHVVSMHENITGCLCPSKLYGIMAAGRNVLAIADPKTELCQTVQEQAIGWNVAPGSSRSIARAVAFAAKTQEVAPWVTREQRQRARASAISRYDRQIVVEKFARLIGECLPGEATTPATPATPTVPTIAAPLTPSGTDVVVPV